MFNKILMESITIYMGSLHRFTFKKGLKEMFSQICRSAGRVPWVRKRKSELGPFISSPVQVSLHDKLSYHVLKKINCKIMEMTFLLSQS